jgi:hypothetical protein
MNLRKTITLAGGASIRTEGLDWRTEVWMD